MIEFDHVSFRYPHAAAPTLHDVSLRIDEGEFIVVAGASGAGKSTLLRAINGLVPHFYGGVWSGTVRVAGRDTRQHAPRELADVVGFVLQDPEAQTVAALVEDEIAFGLENLGVAPRVMRRRVEEVLDQLEIAGLRRRAVATLSGGERQRVAIASVLALQPRILVLDEPTSQLDPHTAEEVLTALQKLNADLGLTVVLSEHRLERVVQYADRLLFAGEADQQRGNLGQAVGGWTLGTPDQVLQRAPFAPPLAEFGRAVGWTPLPLTIKVARQWVQRAGWDAAQSKDSTAGTTEPTSRTPDALPAQPPAVPDVHAPKPRLVPDQQRRTAWRVFAGRIFPKASLPPTQAVPQTPTHLHLAALSATLDGHEVLHNVGFDVAAGEIVAVMGRNGAGKTTLMRAIMGLLPYRGSVVVDGTALEALPTEERARMIGYVPQDPRALLFQPTVAQELRWTLQQHTTHAIAPDDPRILAVLETLGLSALHARYPRDLSSGEQQRVALAAILVVQPRIVLLDEPTRGMDYVNKAKLGANLRTLQAAGHIIVLVTHDVELVAACAERVVLLAEGEVVVDGSVREVLNESLLFSSQIGKLFRRRAWLTVEEALRGLEREAVKLPQKPHERGGSA